MAEFDSLKVKDQLGRPEDKGLFVKRKTEEVLVDDEGVRILKKSIGNSWIVGSATNGLVGTNTATQNGLQQVVGGANREINLRQAVVAIVEFITDTEFIDETSTTATVDTSANTIQF